MTDEILFTISFITGGLFWIGQYMVHSIEVPKDYETIGNTLSIIGLIGIITTCFYL